MHFQKKLMKLIIELLIQKIVSIKSPTNKFTTISNAIRRAGGITSKSDLSKIILVEYSIK